MQNIENIKLDFLSLDDYHELKEAMIEVYNNVRNPYWENHEINTLIKKFPEGQVVIKVNDQLAGCALSIIVDYKKFGHKHTYRKITGNDTFNTHDDDGDVLYGIDLFVKPEFRGMRLGRRLYDYRKDLCERLNLKSIIFGGRIPGYHEYADKMSPQQYINKLKRQELHDPVLHFQLSNDFQPVRIIKSYLDGDTESNDYAVLLKWTNIYYEEEQKEAAPIKKDVRLGLIQWQMRPYKGLDELMQHAEYFVNAVSNYRSDFALFPEFFNAPLMAENNHLSEPEAIRELAKHTQFITDKFSEFAVTYNINIITGSMPEMKGERLYNVGYLCRRDGTVEKYEKLHVTPDEAMVWGLQGGSKLEVFDTDCGKIGILICYDSEFPELSRILAEDGMDILFVPFLTDTQNGFSRVRNCAQARAIENECYVAIAGSVGNLPNVHNMDIQYAQSMVFTPCDFAFPPTGIKAETTPNTEMILIADVDINLLRELNQFGSVKNLRDRRKDLYMLKRND
ncbi:bifunctional GNAT family N-acetyltransferase/carbon-nitrogen hydrolase family protein [Francisella sp. LA112445]|jgi:predicted amidohydrolase/GNAT superfamily N-acetyltransferase|uniref:carbon-nitrogen hydrolase family protein n=1 Tax=Francisella sp. LA112445 TaxID=1395624 RepID=UPI001788DD60|nr:bifunctional GNAT family N-acetyltransferase/carbon-nitrogen hydrolase family protein [Francisella sp. LA112445]QIW09262.1 GNAT family N-acetyltransferase [Francisella sp. LA112445]